MFLKDVIHFKNAFGKPIEVFTVETDTELCITLKEGSNSNHAIAESMPSRQNSPFFTTNGDSIIRANGDSNNLSNGQANGPPNLPSSFRTSASVIDFNPSVDSAIPYDKYIIKILMTIIVATILVLMTHAYILMQESQSVSTLPLSILLTIPLIYVYYKSNHQVTEESLLIYKNSLNTILSSKRSKNCKEPSNVSRDSAITNGYFIHLKKYRLRKPEKKILPIDRLKICESLNGHRIRYNLVVQSDCPNLTSSRNYIDQDSTVSALNLMNSQNQVSNEQFEDFSRQVRDIIIFAHNPPKLDCLEQILSRINSFRDR